MDTKKSNERGELTIEASIIVIIVVLVLYLMFGVCFLVYQQFSMVNIANTAAAQVARVYPLVKVDPENGAVNVSDIEGRAFARRFHGLYNVYNEGRAVKLSKEMLTGITVLKMKSGPKAEARVVGDGVATCHIEVEVSATYKMPGEFIYKYFGLKREVTFSSVGRARCVDMSEYINTVGGAKYAVDKTIGTSKLLSTGKKITELVNKVIGWIT